MHTNQTYNTLKIDNPESLNFPNEMVSFIKNYDWSDVTWNSFGLPAFQSLFCLSGSKLYFESDDSGKVNLRETNFTGQILANTVITPADCDRVFMVSFELCFCMGQLCSNEVLEFKVTPRDEYDKSFFDYQAASIREEKIKNSFLFKYLYKPYFLSIKGVTVAVAFVFQYLLKIFVWCAEKITPMKL